MTTPALHQIKTEFDSVQPFLLAVGDEKRQAIIIALLHDTSGRGLRVGDLTATTRLSRPAVSHHLKLLKEAGIVTIRAEGTKNYYMLANIQPALQNLRSLADDMLTFLSTKENE